MQARGKAADDAEEKAEGDAEGEEDVGHKPSYLILKLRQLYFAFGLSSSSVELLNRK